MLRDSSCLATASAPESWPASAQKEEQTMRRQVRLMIMAVMLTIALPVLTYAASKAEIDRDADNALQKLYNSAPLARTLSEKSRGVLVFPSIVKGGFIIGGQYGDGSLREGGKPEGYY